MQKMPALIIPSRGWLSAASPDVWYREMRDVGPVHYDAERTCYDVFRFEDVQRVLSDHANFSSQRAGEELTSQSIINMDPPKHMKYRQLVAQAFTPKAIEALAPRIEEIAKELLDEVANQPGFDIIRDFSYPLPVIVIAEMLGVPNEDREKFKHWSDIVVKGVDFEAGETIEDNMKLRHSVTQELGAYFAQVIQSRAIQPSNDLITALLASEVDGEKLTIPELLGFCFLLLVAGNETTTNLIGNTMLSLLETPANWERLVREPDLLNSAIEEGLRFRSPAQSMNRFTKEPVEIGGVTIPEGTEVIAWIGSANLDPEKFDRADEFVIDRNPNPHIAFGMGPHFCLGAPLARLEGRIAIQALMNRFPTMKLVEGAEFKTVASPIIYGLKSLPVVR
ncbi:cytochrome P450 [Tumebacillus sp. ITR2]|uniref:Cytochrome P450 n=1 Tax=Tumebacillus amylolyticus TaxID=2801339 RepID=A0ABS1JCP7_9BACL|nr:cytochrome P450 [Tumebacillus amylolyticus]MBL0388020.1 cytochrome P450 [Tumebacillus amylolyticus]